GSASLGGEIVLVPPLQLGRGRQWYFAGRLAANQITAHRDQALAALGPERGHDVCAARSPIESGENGLLDVERIHEGDEIGSQSGWLAVAKRRTGQETRRAVAAKVRDDHPVASGGEQRHDIDEAMDVVRPSMQQNGYGSIGWAGVHIADVQEPGIDLF